MNKDIIYRDEAIDAIHGYWKGELSKMPTTDSEYGEVIDGDCDTLLRHNKELSTRIEDIPSADRPQGKWLLSDLQSQADNDNGNYAYVCTNCKHTDIHAKTQKVPYCWWCGAKMK